MNGAETEAELKALRSSIERGTPFGDAGWQKVTAEQLGLEQLGLESSLRPGGRPRLHVEEKAVA